MLEVVFGYKIFSNRSCLVLSESIRLCKHDTGFSTISEWNTSDEEEKMRWDLHFMAECSKNWMLSLILKLCCHLIKHMRKLSRSWRSSSLSKASWHAFFRSVQPFQLTPKMKKKFQTYMTLFLLLKHKRRRLVEGLVCKLKLDPIDFHLMG